MPNFTGYSDLVGTFIDAWADQLVEPFKNIAPVLADAKFSSKEMVGGVYHVATRLTYEGGQTFGAPQTQPGTSGTAFVGPRAGQTPDAQLQGMQIIGRSQLTYEVLARTTAEGVNGTETDKKKAVRSASKIAMEGLLQGTLKKLESQMLHGREGLGQLDTTPATLSNVVATTYEGVAGFHCDIAISASTWSEALWLMLEGHTLDLFADSAGLPSGAKLNTAVNTALSGTNQNGFIITAINPTTPLTNAVATGRVIRLFHSSGTAGVTGTGVLGGWTTPATPSVATQHLMYESASPTVEFVGLGLMAQNSGTLFNINAANYSMWRGNVFTNVGNLRLSTLIRYLARPINAGGQGLRYRAVVPTDLFAQFANDESTLRRYAAVTGKAENGFDTIEMYAPGGSTLEILGHNLQKDGRVIAYVPDEIMRVGSQDLDFVNRSARRREDFVLEVANQPASEVRLFGQFAPICATPRHMLSLTGVTF